ncbi:MAG: hypothetical protein OXG72_10630 [Acidobacteria bacterium]|nr:hypothetical protein [Acidobacteriota bacterium]
MNEPRTTSAGTPCEQCPWRVANHGKRHPGGFYRKDNLRRLWNQIRKGSRLQSCHPTDAGHEDHRKYAGAKPGAKPLECIGSVILILREMRYADTLDGNTTAGELSPTDFDRYMAETRQRKRRTTACCTRASAARCRARSATEPAARGERRPALLARLRAPRRTSHAVRGNCQTRFDRHRSQKLTRGPQAADRHPVPCDKHAPACGKTHPMHDNLRTVRNALDLLEPPGGTSPPGLRTDPNTLATRPGALPPITRLHMGTFRSSNGRDTAGCSAGVTITLFPDAARKAAGNLITERRWRPGRLPAPIPRIVGAILDAPYSHVCNLLYPAPKHYAREQITPQQAIAALDRFAAGDAPWPIGPLT